MCLFFSALCSAQLSSGTVTVAPQLPSTDTLSPLCAPDRLSWRMSSLAGRSSTRCWSRPKPSWLSTPSRSRRRPWPTEKVCSPLLSLPSAAPAKMSKSPTSPLLGGRKPKVQVVGSSTGEIIQLLASGCGPPLSDVTLGEVSGRGPITQQLCSDTRYLGSIIQKARLLSPLTRSSFSLSGCCALG